MTATTTLGAVSPNQEKTPRKTFRCDDDLWQQALAVAKARDEHLSDALRRFLKQYVAKGAK